MTNAGIATRRMSQMRGGLGSWSGVGVSVGGGCRENWVQIRL